MWRPLAGQMNVWLLVKVDTVYVRFALTPKQQETRLFIWKVIAISLLLYNWKHETW